MWSVTYTLRKILGKREVLNIGTIKIVGEHKQPYTYIYCIWKLRNGQKVYGAIPRKRFDKRIYNGDERLCKYILKYFGHGFYSILRALGKRKGTKSVFYGRIEYDYFIRYKRNDTILINDSGMSPHLTSTMPIGTKHSYVR